MKILALFFFFSLILPDSYGQDLKNTEWIKIKMERVDGSKVIDKNQSEEASLQYYFTADSVFISTHQEYSEKLSYSVPDKTLSIGKFARYKIDSLNDTYFIISELSAFDTPNNKLNRYFFINADYLYDYLKKNNSLQVEGDTLAICNKRFAPSYMGSFTKLFLNQFDAYADKTAEGSFIITPDGAVKGINLDKQKNFTTKEINRIKTIFSSTSGSWILPPSPGSLSFKMKFSLSISGIFGRTSFSLDFFPLHLNSLTTEQQLEEAKYYDKGSILFNANKFEEAVKQFTKCISIDSLDVDAYYNLAACYQKLGNKEKACETWKKLKDMGQKNGELLYNQNCQ